MIQIGDLVQVTNRYSSYFGKVGEVKKKDAKGQWIVYSHCVNDHFPESSLRKVSSYNVDIP